MKTRLGFVLVLALLAIVFSVAAQASTYYVSVRSAKVRAEASTSAALVTTLRRNDAVTFIESVEGTRVSGSKVWYHVTTASGLEGYIHSSLVTDRAPAGGSSTGGSSGAVSTPVPQPVASGGSCPNLSATCSQLTCDQAYACLAAGNGSLDRDKDGKPCESQCGG